MSSHNFSLILPWLPGKYQHNRTCTAWPVHSLGRWRRICCIRRKSPLGDHGVYIMTSWTSLTDFKWALTASLPPSPVRVLPLATACPPPQVKLLIVTWWITIICHEQNAIQLNYKNGSVIVITIVISRLMN